MQQSRLLGASLDKLQLEQLQRVSVFISVSPAGSVTLCGNQTCELFDNVRGGMACKLDIRYF